MKKDITISVHELIIKDQEFKLDSFDLIEDGDVEKSEIRRSSGVTEVTYVQKVVKGVKDNRYLTFYFLSADKYPYSPDVVNSNLEIHQNPRPPEELELGDQFFVLMDIEKQRVYLSNIRKKKFLSTWLSKRTGKETIIKSIMQENDFVEKIKKINTICLTVVPNLYNSVEGSTFSESLVRDIFGFGGDKATLKIDFNNKDINTTILDKIKSILQHKENFEELVVIGRDEENLESILNLEEIVNKIKFEAEANNSTQQFDPDDIFTKLIQEIS